MLLLVLLLIPVLYWTLEFSSVLGVALGLLAIYLLHRNFRDRGVSNPTTGDEQAGPAPQESPAWQESSGWQQSRAPQGPPASQHPAWRESTMEHPTDPQHPQAFSATAPPSRSAQQVRPTAAPRKPRRHSITLVTTALAVAAGIAAGLLDAPLFAAFAIPLGVLGLGMVVGAFLRGGRGLIVLAVPVGAAAMFISVLPTGANGYPAPFDAPWRGTESVAVHPKTERELQPEYRTSVGEIDLDLTGLRLDGRTARTAASSQLGQVEVIVPREVDVEVTCSTKAGAVDCFDERRSGTGTSARVRDTGPDGPGGGLLQLDLSTSTGKVEVSRD